jgi:hypothetical protein
MPAGVEAFKVEWPTDQLDRLRASIRTFAIPASPVEPCDWRYGCPPDVLRRLCRHWLDGYDAAAAARDLNRYPQFIARVEEVDVHFLRWGPCQECSTRCLTSTKSKQE